MTVIVDILDNSVLAVISIGIRELCGSRSRWVQMSSRKVNTGRRPGQVTNARQYRHSWSACGAGDGVAAARQSECVLTRSLRPLQQAQSDDLMRVDLNPEFVRGFGRDGGAIPLNGVGADDLAERQQWRVDSDAA
jgi:hypothetical protein